MPQPQRGEVLVRIDSVSLNFRDLSLVLGGAQFGKIVIKVDG
jgi:NADPH:quinone reductase-like Zn-dependent oxidoreductase